MHDLAQFTVVAFTSIFILVDPFAAIPAFLVMTAYDDQARRRRMAKRAAWTCLIVLGAFGLLGSWIFRIFGITLPAFEIVANHFAALCDRAARHGLLVAFEFLPWSDVPDVAAAWRLIRLADRKNGGLLIDTWHYFRGAADPVEVRSVPAA